MFCTRNLCVLALVVAGCGPSSHETPEDNAGDGDGGGTGDPCANGACDNDCPSGTSTTLTGRVVAPNGVDPIPFAQVYIPSSVPPIPEGVACEVCSEQGVNALVMTTTAVDGSFTLGPIPTMEGQQPGREFDLVVQKGRFRKVSTLTVDAPCDVNEAVADSTTLPSRTEGANNIPSIAVATGAYDVMECVLLDLGLEADAFDLYDGVESPLGGGTPGAEGDLALLLGDLERMKRYNVIFINCSDDEYEDQLANEAIRRNLEDYVAAGGRLYVTDWSYDYIEQVPEFAPVIDFAPGMSDMAPEPRNAAAVGPDGVQIDATVEDDGLAEWLVAVEQVTGKEVVSDDGKVHLEHFLAGWVQQFDALAAETTKVWLRGESPGGGGGGGPGGGLTGMRPLTTTFDYQECGRVLYSSYHTTGRGDFDFDPLNPGDPFSFPGYCSAEGFSPQEMVLMFLVLHVADCITDDVE